MNGLIVCCVLFRPKRSPLFLLDLGIENGAIRYSTPLESFETALVALFDKGIKVTHNIPQLEGVRCHAMD